MKYIKILSLAAISTLTVVAFMGAGTASATVLCKTTPSVVGLTICPKGWDYEKGTEITASLAPKTTIKFTTTTGTLLSECKGAAIEGVTMNTGSATETVNVEVTNEGLRWFECSTITETVLGGKFIIHHISESDEVGTLTDEGFGVTLNVAGATCTYGAGAGADVGKLTGGENPKIDISVVWAKTAGSFLCQADVRWSAEYIVETPKPIWIGEHTE